MKILKQDDIVVLNMSDYEARVVRSCLENTLGFCMIKEDDQKTIEELADALGRVGVGKLQTV